MLAAVARDLPLLLTKLTKLTEATGAGRLSRMPAGVRGILPSTQPFTCAAAAAAIRVASALGLWQGTVDGR